MIKTKEELVLESKIDKFVKQAQFWNTGRQYQQQTTVFTSTHAYTIQSLSKRAYVGMHY